MKSYTEVYISNIVPQRGKIFSIYKYFPVFTFCVSFRIIKFTYREINAVIILYMDNRRIRIEFRDTTI